MASATAERTASFPPAWTRYSLRTRRAAILPSQPSDRRRRRIARSANPKGQKRVGALIPKFEPPHRMGAPAEGGPHMLRRLVRTASSLPSVLVLVLVVTMGAPGRATAQPIPPNHDSSAMPGNEAEDAIAVNPTNPLNIVTMSTLPDVPSGLFEGVSFDGGQTWTRQVIGTGSPLGEICCDEQLTFDAYGNLWMTYLLNTNGNVP